MLSLKDFDASKYLEYLKTELNLEGLATDLKKIKKWVLENFKSPNLRDGALYLIKKASELEDLEPKERKRRLSFIMKINNLLIKTSELNEENPDLKTRVSPSELEEFFANEKFSKNSFDYKELKGASFRLGRVEEFDSELAARISETFDLKENDRIGVNLLLENGFTKEEFKEIEISLVHLPSELLFKILKVVEELYEKEILKKEQEEEEIKEEIEASMQELRNFVEFIVYSGLVKNPKLKDGSPAFSEEQLPFYKEKFPDLFEK